MRARIVPAKPNSAIDPASLLIAPPASAGGRIGAARDGRGDAAAMIVLGLTALVSVGLFVLAVTDLDGR